MRSVIISLLLTLRASLRDRAALQLEILALRHQLQVLERTRPRRVRLTRSDRLLWVWLSGVWRGWRAAVVIVKPETVLAWHRQGFRLLWTWKSRHRPGRPAVPPDVRALIRTMSDTNPLWGAPRIHGELLKLGIDVSQATVAKYMARRRRPPSQTWRTFLANHVDQIVAADFFVVPTVTYRLLFVLVILAHRRRARRARRASPRIRPRRGPRNNSARRFLKTRPRAISFTIATTRLPRSRPRRVAWASRRSAPPLVPRGRTRMRSGSSAPSDASVSIT